jgi:hypothetical protein
VSLSKIFSIGNTPQSTKTPARDWFFAVTVAQPPKQWSKMCHQKVSKPEPGHDYLEREKKHKLQLDDDRGSM